MGTPFFYTLRQKIATITKIVKVHIYSYSRPWEVNTMALDIHPIHPLTSRAYKQEDTVIQVGNHKIGGGTLTLIGGPCSIESVDQVMSVAGSVKGSGGQVLRGGAFKPRTSPYSFQGMGGDGLRILKKAGLHNDIPVITEVMSTDDFDEVEASADILQIGARNMQNYNLLKRAGQSKRPILLKRGMSATIDEWLNAAEYIMAEGNSQVILCERGIRTFENYTRNTLDLSAIVAVKTLSHLPVIIDPSHATGRADMVPAMAKAAVAAGADGLMIEVHNDPANALCDGPQSLKPEEFDVLAKELRKIHEVVRNA